MSKHKSKLETNGQHNKMKYPSFCYTGKKRPAYLGSMMLGKKPGQRIRLTGFYSGVYEILDEKNQYGDHLVMEYNLLGSIVSLIFEEK